MQLQSGRLGTLAAEQVLGKIPWSSDKAALVAVLGRMMPCDALQVLVRVNHDLQLAVIAEWQCLLYIACHMSRTSPWNLSG